MKLVQRGCDVPGVSSLRVEFRKILGGSSGPLEFGPAERTCPEMLLRRKARLFRRSPCQDCAQLRVAETLRFHLRIPSRTGGLTLIDKIDSRERIVRWLLTP